MLPHDLKDYRDAFRLFTDGEALAILGCILALALIVDLLERITK